MNVSYNLCSDLKKRLLPDSALDVEKYTSYRASLIACYFFRYHLQAFRHLYVLAAEPRVLVPREVDTKKACYVPLEVTLKVGNQLFLCVRRGSLFQLYCCWLFARTRITLVQRRGNRFPFSRPLDKCNAASGSEIGIVVLLIVFNCWFTKVESIFIFSCRKPCFTPRPV